MLWQSEIMNFDSIYSNATTEEDILLDICAEELLEKQNSDHETLLCSVCKEFEAESACKTCRRVYCSLCLEEHFREPYMAVHSLKKPF